MRIYPKSLKQEAADRLGRLNCNPRKVLLVYAAVAFGVSLVAALMNVFLNSRVAQTGGLDGLEVKALWETTASVSELAITFLSPIWSLGLVAVVLGFARGKDAQPKDLTAGFHRFFAGLGLHLLTILLYLFASLIAVYIGTALMGFLQSQLDNISRDAFRTVDVSVGIEPLQDGVSGVSTRTDYSFSIAKRLWNDRIRIVIGGSVTTSNERIESDDIINNISIEWRIVPNGSQYLRFFYDKNYESILEGEIRETGVGYAYRRQLRKLKL